jgi:hypothetical protein
MNREKLSQDELRALILAEVDKAGLEDKPTNLTFLGTEETACGQNWTVSFQGAIMFTHEAKALGAIIQRLGEQYDIEWRALH